MLKKKVYVDSWIVINIAFEIQFFTVKDDTHSHNQHIIDNCLIESRWSRLQSSTFFIWIKIEKC